MTVKRMDNVGIVVDDIDAAIEFFTDLGLEFEGRVRGPEGILIGLAEESAQPPSRPNAGQPA